MTVVPSWVSAISIVSGPVPLVVDALALAAIALVVVRRGPWRWAAITVSAVLVGAGVGLALCWLLSDRLKVIEVSLSPVSRAWVAAAFAGCGALAVGIVRGRAGRRAIASAGLVATLLAGAIGVNADFGQYTTVGSLAGTAASGKLSADHLVEKASALDAPIAGAATRLAGSPAPADQPREGTIGTVRIPGTLSHFPARAAYVYLPPRALVQNAPKLPVLILLSGQPGGPDSMVEAGQVKSIFNAYAAAHRGLAPIVVIPDQLTAPQVNPMCLDTSIGNSATYLTKDVPAWILHHLNVQTQVGSWGIGGFSQGGTCTIQLGAGHPALWSALLDISGQMAPFTGSVARTIAVGFGGSEDAYRAALPMSLLAAHAPYRNTVAVFTSGQLDSRYGPIADAMDHAATSAGMRTTRLVSPGTAHDWATVRWSLAHGLPILARHMGLQS